MTQHDYTACQLPTRLTALHQKPEVKTVKIGWSQSMTPIVYYLTKCYSTSPIRKPKELNLIPQNSSAKNKNSNNNNQNP